MNRQERRKLFGRNAAAAREPVFNLTKSRLAELVDEAVQLRVADITARAYALSLVISFINLRDMYSFGPKRLDAFAQRCANTFDSVGRGYVSFDELVDQVQEETGIRVVAHGDAVRVIPRGGIKDD